METNIEINIEDIRKGNLKHIPDPCKGCVYWEFPRDYEKGKEDSQKKGEFEVKKREWFEQTMKEFGTCGKLVYHNGKAIAYAQYAPTRRLPQSNEYEYKDVGKIEDGIVFLSCLYIPDKAWRQKGIGEKLLQNIIEDMRRRGFKAIETFASRSEADNPSGPMMFYIRNGFHIKDRRNPEFPLMRFYL